MSAKPTLFIVDDDPAVRDALAFLLRVEGFQVECYDSAQAFLDSYDPARPGCLLLDIRMPGMSGQELLEELAADRIRLPVIVITGRGDGELARRLLKEGVEGYLEKPFSREVLLEKIHHACERETDDEQSGA